MVKYIIVVFALLLSLSAHSDVGYATIENIRFDDARGDFRISVKSDGRTINGAVVRDLNIIVKENHGVITNTSNVLSVALAAMLAKKTVWVKYTYSGNASGSNYLEAINIYN